MVDPGKRLIFWMNAFDAGEYLLHIDGVTDAAHLSRRLLKESHATHADSASLEIALEKEYWYRRLAYRR